MKFFVSGLCSVETTLAVRGFPITYYPIDYPFFGIKNAVGGSGYRVAAGLKAVGDEVEFLSVAGSDRNGERVLEDIRAAGLSDRLILKALTDTVEAVVLQETPYGRRQVYCDLKDAQDIALDETPYIDVMAESDVCVLCNVNFNRRLLVAAKRLGKKIATDVQNLTDINDPFNSEFIDCADILFLSDEGAPTAPDAFLKSLADRCEAEIIVMGLSEEGLLCFERASGKIHKLAAESVGDVLTAGAGSALFSGFLHYYGKYDLIEALRRAQGFAALKLLKNSKGGGFPGESEVDEFLKNR